VKTRIHITNRRRARKAARPSPTPLPLQPDAPPNDNCHQDGTGQQHTGFLARRRALEHKCKQRWALGTWCAGGTHINSGALDGLARPEQTRATLDDAQRQWEAVRVRREGEDGLGAHGRVDVLR
jgi:hypothetical protein